LGRLAEVGTRSLSDQHRIIGGRRRTVIGLTLGAAGLLIALLWVWSGWRTFVFKRGSVTLWAQEGCIGLEVREDISKGRRGFGYWLDLPTPEAEGFHSLSWRARARRLPDQLFDPSPPRRMLGTDLMFVGCVGFETFVGDVAMYERDYCAAAWSLWVALLAASAHLIVPGWRARLRIRRGGCARCGYSLSGLAGTGACPECGAAQVGTECRVVVCRRSASISSLVLSLLPGASPRRPCGPGR
jgi:hypothetical protein